MWGHFTRCGLLASILYNPAGLEGLGAFMASGSCERKSEMHVFHDICVLGPWGTWAVAENGD